MKVFIDGENFRHQIAEYLVRSKKIIDKNAYFGFDIAGFFKELVGATEIFYYTTKIKQPESKIPKKLADTIDVTSKENRKWIAQLTNQKIKVIKAGYLRVRQSSTCVHCGKKTLMLQEKGVDVRVATDLLMAATSGKDYVALVSSDSDMVPALQTVRKMGGKVMYVCRADRLNRSVAVYANKVTTYDDALIEKYYKVKK